MDQAVQEQFRAQVTRSMEGVAEQNLALIDMMKQILDAFNDLKVKQIETQEAVREIQSCTEAVEAQTTEINEQVPPAMPRATDPADPGSSALGACGGQPPAPNLPGA